MQEATLTLYRVRQAGFYNDVDEHEFATLEEAMNGIVLWAAGLGSIGESSTYPVSEDDDILRAFCFDIRDLEGGRYLIATWNELPAVAEGVQVIQVTSQIGAANISSVDIDAMSLPGYPAYFCVDTLRRRIVNIRFDQRLNGSRQFQRFVAGFLTSFSPWCVWDRNNDEVLFGYSDDEDDDPEINDGVAPKFATTLVRTHQEEDFIRQNWNDIRKIIRRTTIDPEVESQKKFLDSAFSLAGMPVNNRLKADIKFEYTFKTRLTPLKLDSVINEHENNLANAWDDVGFTFARNSKKVHWLSGGLARAKRELPVGRIEGGMINMDDLANYLCEHMSEVLDSFDE